MHRTIIQLQYTLRTSTVCLGSSDSFYAVSNYIKWVTTSWTHSTIMRNINVNKDKLFMKQRQINIPTKIHRDK